MLDFNLAPSEMKLVFSWPGKPSVKLGQKLLYRCDCNNCRGAARIYMRTPHKHLPWWPKGPAGIGKRPATRKQEASRRHLGPVREEKACLICQVVENGKCGVTNMYLV